LAHATYAIQRRNERNATDIADATTSFILAFWPLHQLRHSKASK